MTTIRNPLACLLTLATALALAPSAAAQQVESGGAETTPAAEDSGEGDIVVTALRRDQNLQDVPAAVTAFTTETISNAGIERPSDFINLTSNVNLVETQNAGNAFVIIRGITQARNSEPSVAVVVDGVQQVNPAQFNQELFDIAQIEVLKGPQGGLYGRNAIGGAIVINSKKPNDFFEGNVKVGIDNGFGFYARGGISGPISDTLKFRVSGSYYDTEGFLENTFLDEKADPVRDLGLRANLLWDPTDALTVDLRASTSQLRTQALYFNIVNDVNDTSLPIRVNNRGQNDRDIYNASLKITYRGSNATLTSVTSYDTLEEVLTGDAFNFLPIEESLFFGFFGFDLNQSQYLDLRAISQEIRLSSPEGSDSPLNWTVGGYIIDTQRFISTGNMVDTDNGVFPVFREPSTNPLNPQFSFLADEQDNFAWAVFLNAGYAFSDYLRADASLRYDKDRRRQTTLTPTAFLPNVPGFPQGATGDVRRVSFDDWQPKLTLTWEPTPRLTIYGGYSRGFRSGGFNQTGVGPVAAVNGFVGVADIFDAETAESFELGAKGRIGKLNLSASAYTTKSKNSYFFVFLAANSTQNLGNVPEARIEGFELEARLQALPGLDFNAGWGMTFSEIEEFADASRIGNELPLISRSTLNLGAQYSGTLSGDVDALLRLDYRRTGRTWWDVENSTVREPIELVDARAGLTFGGFALTAFADNLFDEEYNAEFSPGGFVFKARPRRYGLELGYKF